MNLENAANLGDLLGGMAILGTLIFGVRQIVELKKTKEKEAARELANIFSSPMYQTGMSLFLNKFPDDITMEDAANFTRSELDAMSYTAYNINSVAIMTFGRQLSFTTVAKFMQPVNIIIGKRLRIFIALVRENAKLRIEMMQDDYEIFDWTIWLLDRMDELPPIDTPANILYSDWKP